MCGQVYIEDGWIVVIIEGDVVFVGVEDCGGVYLVFGLIELYIDNLECYIQLCLGVNWLYLVVIFVYDGEFVLIGIIIVFDVVWVGLIFKDGVGYVKYVWFLVMEINVLVVVWCLCISYFIYLCIEICSEILMDELVEFILGDCVWLVSLMDYMFGQCQFCDISKFVEYVQGLKGLSNVEFDEYVVWLKDLCVCFGDVYEVGVVVVVCCLGVILVSYDDIDVVQVVVSVVYGVRLVEFFMIEEVVWVGYDYGILNIMGGLNLIWGGLYLGNIVVEFLVKVGLLDIILLDYVFFSLLLGVCYLVWLWDDLLCVFCMVIDVFVCVMGLDDWGWIVVGLCVDLIWLVDMECMVCVIGVWVEGCWVG